MLQFWSAVDVFDGLMKKPGHIYICDSSDEKLMMEISLQLHAHGSKLNVL